MTAYRKDDRVWFVDYATDAEGEGVIHEAGVHGALIVLDADPGVAALGEGAACRPDDLPDDALYTWMNWSEVKGLVGDEEPVVLAGDAYVVPVPGDNDMQPHPRAATCAALAGCGPCDCGRHPGVVDVVVGAPCDELPGSLGEALARAVEDFTLPHMQAGVAINPKEVAAGGEGRIPWQALPVRPLVGAALAMGEGAHKYGRHNYRKTRIKSSVYFDSTLRHFFAWWEGEDIDAASGLHHIDKTIAGLLVLRDAQLRGMSDDDRPPACDAGWIGASGAEFGRMRDKLAAAHGPAKAPARNDGK